MHNCLILGSGRSGTSMVAGVLSCAGYYMGETLLPPTPSNPKGYYESVEIEAINEYLLRRVVPRRPRGFFGRFFGHRPNRDQRWLARVPVGKKIPCLPKIADRIQRQTRNQPFCFKDPRFSYTLPAWRPFLQDTVFVCVFREPMATADSILKNWRDEPYLQSLAINFDGALRVWELMYRHILEIHRREGDWLFLHFNQVLTGEGIDRLEQLTGAKADRSFPDATLSRSVSERPAPASAQIVYGQLCKLAGYAPSGSSPTCGILGHFFLA
jgi:hypothetical protein